MSSPPDEAVAGALIGLALGDALGFVVEAEPPAVAQAYARLLRGGRAGERAHPRFPFGQYSDDTQFARELLLSVADAGGWDPARFAERVAALVFAGRDVGAGPGTRSAGLRLRLGAPWTHAGAPSPYAGNGSAMRVAPLGALYRDDEARWRRYAREQSRVTHQDPRCAAGAVAVAGATVLASRAGRLDADTFLERVAGWVEPEDRGVAVAVRALGAWLSLDPVEAAGRVRAAGLDPGHQNEWRGISAHVIPSVIWSLYAFLRTPDDWWETVCTAIAVGGDTDTMAAMAGAIAGARRGVSALPAALIARLTDRGEWDGAALIALARRCARTAGPPRGGGDAGVIVAEPTPT
jgi:ADP-ribosylglycohydrolase